jgi:3-methyladenine DNA glycosylase AlkD
VTVSDLATALEAELRQLGDTVRAAGAKAYLKSDLEFLGVAAKPLRDAVRSCLDAHPEIGRRELEGLASRLWSEPVFELKAAAVAVLERRQRQLDLETLELAESMLASSGTWALVDFISTKVVAPIVSRHPEAEGRLRRWASADDFWLRRAALLSLLPDLRAGGGDFELFAELVVPMLGEREFFVRKAVGWVLRDTSRRRPELVAAFVEMNRDAMSGLTFREATRALPEPIRERLGSPPRSRKR